MLARLALLGLACAASSCVAATFHLKPMAPRCFDGLPPEILTDPRCPPDGICGYSCLPDRWDGKLLKVEA